MEQKWPSQELFLKPQSRYLVGLGSKTLLLDSITKEHLGSIWEHFAPPLPLISNPADVSRWLTLGQHWCRWVLLSFNAFVRPSNHPWAWVCVLHTKRLEEMAYNLACWCIQMAYTQHSWMLMDIVVGLSVRPYVRLFVYGIFRWLCICWQITWNKWHKIWHADVSPSLISLSQHWC